MWTTVVSCSRYLSLAINSVAVVGPAIHSVLWPSNSIKRWPPSVRPPYTAIDTIRSQIFPLAQYAILLYRMVADRAGYQGSIHFFFGDR